MNWVDAAIIISLAVAGFWGLSAGLIRIILPLLTLIIGLVLASRLDNQAGSLFSPLTDSEGGQRLLGFIAVFLLVFLSGGLVSTLVKAGMRFMFFLSPIDHLLGAVAGVILGLLLVGGILIAQDRYPVTGIEDDVRRSVMGEFMVDKADDLIRGIRFIPKDWERQLDKLP